MPSVTDVINYKTTFCKRALLTCVYLLWMPNQTNRSCQVHPPQISTWENAWRSLNLRFITKIKAIDEVWWQSHTPNENKFQYLKSSQTWETMNGRQWVFLMGFSSFLLTSWYPTYPRWLRPHVGPNCIYFWGFQVAFVFQAPLPCMITESSVFVNRLSSLGNPICMFWATHGEGFGSGALCKEAEGISSLLESFRDCILHLSTP